MTDSPLDGVAILNETHAIMVTPELAAELLLLNHDNRSLSEKRVKALEGAIKRGEWQFNGDTISVSLDHKRLLNGQHRLHAIVNTKTAVPLLVAEVQDEAQTTMDRGRSRTFADWLHMRGVAYAPALSTVISNIWAYEASGIPSRQGTKMSPSIEQLAAIYDANPHLLDSIRVVNGTPGMSVAFAATHHYIFAKVDAADAQDFFEGLRTGSGLVDGSPILTLRERMMKEQQASTSVPVRTRSAWMFLAFNAYRRGQQLYKIGFRSGGSDPQDFPKLWGDD